jgi:hypothetical protein
LRSRKSGLVRSVGGESSGKGVVWTPNRVLFGQASEAAEQSFVSRGRR